MIIDEDDYLAHYGILRKSGRYPWGSGKTQEEINRTFLGTVEDMRSKGMSDTQIARGLGITTTQLRQAKSLAKESKKQDQISTAQKLKDKGYSNVAIGKHMDIPESSVRALLAPGVKDKLDIRKATSDMLKEQVSKKKYIDIGKGVENHLGISREKLNKAVAALADDGYTIHYIRVDQLGTNHQTTIKVLAAPGTPYKEVFGNRDQIQQALSYSENGGRSYDDVGPPIHLSSKRISVRYGDQGGSAADGVIYVRPGVKDVSLGGAQYAQVRVAVDGTHYLKGMAVYNHDLPPGVDVEFNTNKKDTGNKLDAMKPLKDDEELPFGAIVRQLNEIGPDGKKRVYSTMNIVNSEGRWADWSKSLSTQMLSKQPTTLAKQQLDITYQRKQKELEEILSLTNREVKKKLLQTFSDSADSAAVHLKAAALPRQESQVILPVNSMKPTEVYAPNFRDGERVVLVRYPHGGIFEIPELTVNNRHPEAKKLLGDAKDAIGIHSKVAERLSGADFDGDTVLVIPNNQGRIKTKPALEGLKGFDPQTFKLPDTMPRMSARTKGIQMGLVSNLINDMHIRGATDDELARAVRHSMVVIDAEKHHLDYQRSARENGISALMLRYQGKSTGGASTLISNSGTSTTIRVPERKPRATEDGGPIDRATGKKMFTPTGATYIKRTVSKRTGEVVEKVVPKLDKTPTTKLAEVDDAHVYSSGTPIEKVYADHSNRMKALANQARKEMVNTPHSVQSNSARSIYSKEVRSLNASLDLALRNSPLERQAQILANAALQKKKAANPDMEPAELKKLKARELLVARTRTGAQKQHIEISDHEWAAIQAGALSSSRLREILDNADMDRVKKLATPKEHVAMPPAALARAKAMKARGVTQADIADALGVSLSTLKRGLGGDQNG